ncbi:MAG: hypothetical protein NC489_12950 [Ruminococcus flavefaciens]|nr:hypothetical protein [Ruminococcus flavefaciens]
MKYMNDSEEYLNGLKEVRDYLLHGLDKENVLRKAAEKRLTKNVFERRMEDEINSFSISFTTARDLLSQWSMYAKESGVSLKMGFEERDYKFLAFEAGSDNEKAERKQNYSMHPRKVYYFTKEVLDNNKYQETGNEIVNEMTKYADRNGMLDYEDNIEKLWLWITPFVKRADFGAEEEYRLVFDFGNVSCFTPRVDFRTDKNVIKPYLDIEIEEGWPITEIIVEPGFNQEAVFNGIVYYLSKGVVKVPPISLVEMGKRMQRYFQDMKKESISSVKVNKWVRQWSDLYDFITEDSATNPEETMLSRLYQEFKKYLGTISNDNICREYIRNNFLALSGIVLRKSRIPYIY